MEKMFAGKSTLNGTTLSAFVVGDPRLLFCPTCEKAAGLEVRTWGGLPEPKTSFVCCDNQLELKLKRIDWSTWELKEARWNKRCTSCKQLSCRCKEFGRRITSKQLMAFLQTIPPDSWFMCDSCNDVEFIEELPEECTSSWGDNPAGRSVYRFEA